MPAPIQNFPIYPEFFGRAIPAKAEYAGSINGPVLNLIDHIHIRGHLGDVLGPDS